MVQSKIILKIRFDKEIGQQFKIIKFSKNKIASEKATNREGTCAQLDSRRRWFVKIKIRKCTILQITWKIR